MREMVMANEDVVQIQGGQKPGDPFVVTINCPDKTGLGCDLCRIILEFGLSITRADVSTDGRWCYVIFWVLPPPTITSMRWSNLKSRLLSVCPSCSISFFFDPPARSAPSLYLLKFLCLNRKGLLHDVTQVLSELELIIQRVKVSTTPDGRVMDLFFVTDNMELLHTKKRQDETCQRLNAVLGDSCLMCELQLAGPEYEKFQNTFSSVTPEVSDELFSSKLSYAVSHFTGLSPELAKLKKSIVTIDNSLSPAHTLLQLHCVDQKGLIYDIMRTLKDCNIQVSYGRFATSSKCSREIDLFIQQTDGKKIVDPDKQDTLSLRLKMEMLHPLRVVIANRGPDTELLVANPVELSGKGRPRVFYDVTFAFKVLGICIFSAEIGRHSTSDRQWEVYRFLLNDSPEFPLSNPQSRNQIVDTVRKTLMGW